MFTSGSPTSLRPRAVPLSTSANGCNIQPWSLKGNAYSWPNSTPLRRATLGAAQSELVDACHWSRVSSHSLSTHMCPVSFIPYFTVTVLLGLCLRMRIALWHSGRHQIAIRHEFGSQPLRPISLALCYERRGCLLRRAASSIPTIIPSFVGDADSVYVTFRFSDCCMDASEKDDCRCG